VASVILLKEAANIYLPKSIKAAAGATFKLNMTRGPSILDLQSLSIKDLGTSTILALDSRGENLQKFQWPKKCLLLVGEEGAGIPAMQGLKTISIPTQNIESLNATVALSIALYDRNLKGGK
jgi:tRNA G18 (ribose-2'-O)-methylase SpoU